VFVSPRFPDEGIGDASGNWVIYGGKENKTLETDYASTKTDLSNLEARIEVKDQLIEEMTQLQNDLYQNLEDC
jgi:hypothetical protein